MHDPKQQTGRTTRMLLRAILAASEGGRVLVVGTNHEHAAWLCDAARRLAGRIATYRPPALHIGGSGRIQFSGPPTIERAQKFVESGYQFMYDHDVAPAETPRTLDQIVAAVRSGQAVPHDELRRAVVAFDVLLAQLDLPRDPKALAEYFRAAESVPAEYIGEANDPDNAEAVAWYTAMHNAGARSPDVRQAEAVRAKVYSNQCEGCGRALTLEGCDNPDCEFWSESGAYTPAEPWQCPDPECKHRADPLKPHDDCAPF